MLDINPDIVCRIIDLAREFHAKEAVVIPSDAGDDDDWAMQVLADHAGDLGFQSMKSIIDDLEPAQQVQLIALMWQGRGDFEADEWAAALEEAGDAWTENTAEYLIAHPMLADHLDEALAMHGHSCND